MTVASEVARSRETIARFLKRTQWASKQDKVWRFKLPTICVVNDRPVLQKDWNKTRIRSADTVAFISRPLGGGGNAKRNSLLGLVAVIGLSLIAPGIATALLPTSIANASIFGVSVAKIFASAFPSGGGLLSR